MGDVTRIVVDAVDKYVFLIGFGLTVVVQKDEWRGLGRQEINSYTIFIAKTQGNIKSYSFAYRSQLRIELLMENIEHVLRCFSCNRYFQEGLPPPLNELSHAVVCLLQSKNLISEFHRKGDFFFLDLCIFFKNPSNTHEAILQYVTGFSGWTQRDSADLKSVLMYNDSPGCRIKFAYIEYWHPREMLRYELFESDPGNITATKYSIPYKKIDIMSLGDDSLFATHYMKIFETKPDAIILDNETGWFIQQNNLFTLHGIYSILHTHTPLPPGNYEYNFFRHENMVYCAAFEKIPIGNAPSKSDLDMIELISELIGGAREIFFKQLIEARSKIYKIEQNEQLISLNLNIPYNDDEKIQIISSFLLGNDVSRSSMHPVTTNENGNIKTIEFLDSNKIQRPSIIKWIHDGNDHWGISIEIGYRDQAIDTLKEYTIADFLNGPEDPMPSFHNRYSEAAAESTSGNDSVSGGSAGLSSMFTPPENKFLTTLHLLNRMLDTTSAGL